MLPAEEIKNNLDIVELIREYIPVRAVGANFQALCPFHNEKTPSFVISPEKQIWHCFGCGRGGDALAFIMEKEGLSFPEALRFLAPKAGVVLKQDDNQNYSEHNRILDILELAGKYYAHILQTPVGAQARDYLIKRGLTPEIIKDWQIGYSQDSWDSLYNFLRRRPLTGKKYSAEEIFSAGLITKKSEVSSGQRETYYDRFRDRIMFPIWDVNNRLIAFTARVNPEKEKTEKMGKYINSPQTKAYDKSRVLFALNKAKEAIKKENLAIIVEGQMDAISCHQHGFKNAVASSGTALTIEQIKLLKRYTNNFAFALDSDVAGLMANERGSDLINSRRDKIVTSVDEGGSRQLYQVDDVTADINIFIIKFANAKDPDECLRNNPDDFKEALANKKLLMQYFFEEILQGADLTDVLVKKEKSFLFLNKLARINSAVELDVWLKKISAALDISEAVLREELMKRQNKILSEKKKVITDVVKERETLAPVSRDYRLGESMLALLLKFSALISYAAANFSPDSLSDQKLAQFYKNLIIYYNKAAVLDYDNFRLYLKEQAPTSPDLLDRLVLLGEKDFYNYEDSQAKTELINILTDLKQYDKQRQIMCLQKAIAASERAGQDEEAQRLMSDLNILMSS